MSSTREDWFVYEHTVDGLFFKALRTRITPPVQAQLKEIGIDLDTKPRSVLHAQWKDALRIAASLYDGSPDEQYRQVGHAVLERYGDTIMGKAAMAVMRAMGPRRILHRINTALRSGNNYSDCRLTQVGPTSWEGSINECNGNPHYIAGVIEQGLIVAGAQKVEVIVTGFDGHGATYRITWA